MKMLQDKNNTTYDKTQAGEYTGNISRTLSDHSGTHFDRNVGNFALDVVFEVV